MMTPREFPPEVARFPASPAEGLSDEKTLVGLTRSVQPAIQNRQARLIVLVGGGPGRMYTLSQETLLGRSQAAQIQFSVGDISRRHAIVRRLADGQYSIEDLNTSNGTCVNGQLLAPHAAHALDFGDRIQLGARTTLVFTHADPLEEQVMQSQRLEALGQLVGGIAHDFNNLLTVLECSVDWLRDNPDGAPLTRDEALDDANYAVSRAAELTRQLLDFSQRTPRTDESFDLSALVDRTTRLLRRTFEPRTLIHTRLQPQLSVAGDLNQVSQVLVNLCINGRDAMSDGGVIDVRTCEVDLTRAGHPTPLLSQGRYALIEVQDQGVGMDEEASRRVFEPFYTTKRDSGGTGLGLSVCYGIVSDHGGHIEVASEPGEGTTVRVYLPMKCFNRTDGTGGGTLEGSLTGSGTVLLIEHDEHARRSARRILNHLGFEVAEAATGCEGARLLAATRAIFRVVVLDFIQPGSSGSNALDDIRRVRPDVPVVLTGSPRDHEHLGARIYGPGFLFMAKPFGFEKLASTLRTVLYRPDPWEADG